MEPQHPQPTQTNRTSIPPTQCSIFHPSCHTEQHFWTQTLPKNHTRCALSLGRVCAIGWIYTQSNTFLPGTHSAIFKLHMWIGMESNVCCKEQSCTSHFPSNLSGSSLLLLLCCIDWKPSSTQEFVHASLYSRSCVCTETPCMISTSFFFSFLPIGWKERLKWSEPPDMFQSCSSLACRAWKTLTFFTLKKW